MVLVLADLPIELAVLGGTLDAAGGRLLNVDVDVAAVVGVLLDVESDGGEANGFARPPANALQGEDGVGVVGEGLVLAGEVSFRVELWDSIENSHHHPVPGEVLDGLICGGGHFGLMLRGN